MGTTFEAVFVSATVLIELRCSSPSANSFVAFCSDIPFMLSNTRFGLARVSMALAVGQ